MKKTMNVKKKNYAKGKLKRKITQSTEHRPVGLVVETMLSARKVVGSNPGALKSDTVLSTLRQQLYCTGAKSRR